MSAEGQTQHHEGPCRRNDYNYRPLDVGPRFISNDWPDRARKANGGPDRWTDLNPNATKESVK